MGRAEGARQPKSLALPGSKAPPPAAHYKPVRRPSGRLPGAMTTRPIELGLTHNADSQTPSAWQINMISTIVAGLPAWSPHPESPRATDFQTRIDRLRRTLVPGLSSYELADTVERVLQLCDTYFEIGRGNV